MMGRPNYASGFSRRCGKLQRLAIYESTAQVTIFLIHGMLLNEGKRNSRPMPWGYGAIFHSSSHILFKRWPFSCSRHPNPRCYWIAKRTVPTVGGLRFSRPATTFKSHLKLATKEHWYCRYENPSFTLSCFQQLGESDPEKYGHRLRMKALNTAPLTSNLLWKVYNVDWVTLV